jgi:hypothetical protein
MYVAQLNTLLLDCIFHIMFAVGSRMLCKQCIFIRLKLLDERLSQTTLRVTRGSVIISENETRYCLGRRQLQRKKLSDFL